MDKLICHAVVPVEMLVGLTHLDSDLCWCNPIVEVDDIEMSWRSLGIHIRDIYKSGPPRG